MTAATAVFRHRQLDLAGSSIHVIEVGDPLAAPVLFLHGWPEDWSAWTSVMTLAAGQVRAVAIDLPSIGGSNRRCHRRFQTAAGRHGLPGPEHHHPGCPRRIGNCCSAVDILTTGTARAPGRWRFYLLNTYLRK